MSQLLIYNNEVIQIEDKQFPISRELRWEDSNDFSETVSIKDNITDGILTKHIPSREPTKTWREKRQDDYSRNFDLSDQIDIIQNQLQKWSESGVLPLEAKTRAWLDKIAEIKSNHPKPV